MEKAKVAVFIGAASDEATVAPCADILKKLGIPFRFTVTSAHRTPERTAELVDSLEAAGCEVFICAAGMVGIVAARAMAGVHWATDILGGILLGAALVAVYRTIAFADYGKASRGKHARR